MEAERSPLFRASAFTFEMFAVAALIGLTAVLLPIMVVFAARRSLVE